MRLIVTEKQYRMEALMETVSIPLAWKGKNI